MNSCQVTLLIALIIFLLLLFVSTDTNTFTNTNTNISTTSQEYFIGTTQTPFWNSNVMLLGKQLPHKLSKLRYSP